VRLGGQPQGAAYAGGSLWVADYDGYVMSVDPVDRRVLARIPMAGNPTSIAADDRAVWVVSEAEPEWLLTRIDARTDRIVARTRRPVLEVALGTGGVWIRQFAAGGSEIGRIGPTGAVTNRIRLPDGQSLVAGRDTVWALADNGTLTAIDAASGTVRHTLPGAVSPNNFIAPENAVAADAGGAWASDTGAGTVVHVVHGRVVQRIPVAPITGPIARSPNAVWVATADAVRGRNGLARIDPEQGSVTATADLGHHVPRTIVPVGDTVWVIAGDGTATIVRDR
jgi:hypothetical protein